MLNHFHILVVDDEPAQREMIGGFLKKQGFEVIAADSAERALELFRQDAFDLVLTDQKMAEMSGLELLQAVHTINATWQIQISTASSPTSSLPSTSAARSRPPCSPSYATI